VTGRFSGTPLLDGQHGRAVGNIISGGRGGWKVGLGSREQWSATHGIDLPPLRERFARFDEGVEAIVSR